MRIGIYITFLFVLLCNSLYPQQSLAEVEQKANSIENIQTKIAYLHKTYSNTSNEDIYNYCFNELRHIVLKSNAFVNSDTSMQRILGWMFNDIGYDCNYRGRTDSAILYYKKSQFVREKLGDSAGIANNYVNLGYSLQSVSRYDEALAYYKKAIPIYISKNKLSELAGNYNNIASLYNIKGDIKGCIENLMTALSYYTKLNNQKGVAWIYNSLGFVYAQQDEEKLAEDWYNKALDLSLKQKNNEALALIYNNLGSLEQKKGNKDLAIDHYLKSLKIRRALKDIRGEIMSLNNIGNAFILAHNYQRAELYLNDCKDKCLKINSIESLTGCYINFAMLYENWGKLDKAKIFADSAYYLSKKTNNVEKMLEASRGAYKIEKRTGNDARALFHLENSLALQDSLKSKEIQKEIYKKQYEYDLEKQEQAFEFHKREKELELTRQKMVRNIFVISLVIVLFCGIYIAYNLIQSKKKNKIISSQKEFIEDKQKEIVDSITYARRLQSAILPGENQIRSYFKESFIFYKPKDIVAGDFYWFENVNNILFIAAADSTGHGVPGAMVSIVCSNALNKAVKEFGLTDPGLILNKTRELVLETFAKSGEEIRDGMDISLLCVPVNQLNLKDKTVKWAGANNSLWYVKSDVFHEVKATKQPIGKSEANGEFVTHTISLSEGSIVYLFTDGFADQFGGPKSKKFKYKPLAEFLFGLKDEHLSKHPQILNDKLQEWRRNLEQVDDITILGIKL